MTAVADNPPKAPKAEPTGVERLLYTDGGRFDFFQAVTLLERAATRDAAALDSTTKRIRFETPASTAFPATAISEVRSDDEGDTRVTVNFMGLTGPSGVLPRHYTEQIIQVERRLRGAAKRTLRAWYDLFNNRFIAHLFRAWSDRRIDRGVTRGEADLPEPDAFTHSLHSLIGLGSPTLCDRLHVRDAEGAPLDRLRDAGLLQHAGALSRRQRSAKQIGALLTTHFGVPIQIEQFRGQWLALEEHDRTRLGRTGQANRLGVDAVAGSRVWDLQSRVRVKVGPLSREQFQRFLPDTTAGPQRRRFVMLCQLVRLTIGAELDFDVQLILREAQIPPTRLGSPVGQRLGWDAWLATQPLGRDGDDPVFEPIEVTALG